MYSILVGFTRGYEKAWFLSDDFGHSSFEEFYFQRDMAHYTGYVWHHFEVSGFMTNSARSIDSNIISRMRSMLVGAIRDQKLFPKVIVMVPDMDIVNYLLQRNATSSYVMGKTLYWLMNEFRKIISGYKDQLPPKAKKATYPHIIWIQAPCHNSFPKAYKDLRQKFNLCLSKIRKLHLNTSVLELKKIWDPEDSTLVLPGSETLTAKGKVTYWEAVDRTVKYCDTTTLHKEAAKEFKDREQGKMPKNNTNYTQFQRNTENDRYHWHRPSNSNYGSNRQDFQ